MSSKTAALLLAASMATAPCLAQVTPIAVGTQHATVPAPGLSTAITPEVIRISDDSPPHEILFTLTSLPANGGLRLDGNTLQQNDQFTMQDILDLKLAYEHDNSTATSDELSFSVVDGDGIELRTVTIDMTIVNLQEGLVAHWPMSEGSGTTASSETSGGPDLQLTSTSWGDGPIGSSLVFDTGSAVAAAASPTGVSGSGARTISAWVHLDPDMSPPSLDEPLFGYFQGSEVSGRQSFGFALRTFMARPQLVVTIGDEEYGMPDLLPGWNHLALSFDSRRIQGYVNGWKAVNHRLANFEPNLSTLDQFQLGSGSGGAGFSGAMDEVKIYSRQLGDPEIIALASNPPHVMRNEIVVLHGNDHERFVTEERLKATGPAGDISVVWTLVEAPRFGSLENGGAPLTAGDGFTQADIASGNIRYLASVPSRWDAAVLRPSAVDGGASTPIRLHIHRPDIGGHGVHAFVEDGIPVDTRMIGRRWGRVDGHITSAPEEVTQMLFAGAGARPGDFALELTLEMADVANSTARLHLGGNVILLGGEAAANAPTIDLSSAIIANQETVIDISRTNGMISASAGGVTAGETIEDGGPISWIGLNPGHHAVSVARFVLDGNAAPMMLPPPWEYSELADELINTFQGEKDRLAATSDLIELAPVFLPEGPHISGDMDWFGHPVAVGDGDRLALSVRTGDLHDASNPTPVLITTADAGDSWAAPLGVDELRRGFTGEETPQSMTSVGQTGSGAYLWLAARQGLFRSGDRGQSWVYAPRSYTTTELGTRRTTTGPHMVEVPGKGIVNFASGDYYRFSTNDGWTWQHDLWNPGASDPREPAPLVFDDVHLLLLSREHDYDFGVRGNPPAIHYSQHYSRGMAGGFINQTTNIGTDYTQGFTFWGQDTVDTILNPVTNRIEAVTVNRTGAAEPGTAVMQQQTLNLYSIDPSEILQGRNNWRLEGTLLSRDIIPEEDNPLRLHTDSFHPGGSVIDAERGVQHIFVYMGTKDKAGIFRMTRTLSTPDLVEALNWEPPTASAHFWMHY